MIEAGFELSGAAAELLLRILFYDCCLLTTDRALDLWPYWPGASNESIRNKSHTSRDMC